MLLQFKLVPRRDNPTERQWQSVVGKCLLAIPDRESKLPTSEDERWECSRGRVIFRSPDGRFEIISVFLEREVTSERGKRRRDRKLERHEKKITALQKERLKAQERSRTHKGGGKKSAKAG